MAIVAEKPSVGRDLAAVVGATRRGDGCLVGDGWIVTWAVGHLVTLAEPGQMDPAWQTWRRDRLPMLPSAWPLVVLDRAAEQFAAVRRILSDPEVVEVVCATDAGREGELIFRQLYEAARCTKPVKRLWISSLTPEAIRAGLAGMKPARDYDRLADAARGRSRADWLVGMNFSRAFTLAHGEPLTVGRVQTPTLAILVGRELAIRAFVPEEYREVVATFEGESGRYRGTWFDPATKEEGGKRLPKDGVAAEAIVARVREGRAAVASVEPKTRRVPPPQLFDLTELQRHANRLLGWSAKKTLDVAQRLYEERKAITYPRTDSRHLSRDVAAALPAVLAALEPGWGRLFAGGSAARPLGPRFVDDAKVSDHHAIVPTPHVPRGLAGDEKALYEIVVRRLLAAWHDDHVAATTTVVTEVSSPRTVERLPDSGGDGRVVDRFRSAGTMVLAPGWKVVEPDATRRGRGGDEEDAELPPGLATGQEKEVVDVASVERKTRPPKRLTDASLLTAMETAGRTLDEKELAEAMKENGLGTPATRAEVLENLLARGYAERDGKALVATEKGIRLVGLVPESVKSPALTGRWEAELARLQKGDGDLASFLRGIEAYVTSVVADAFRAQVSSPAPTTPDPSGGRTDSGPAGASPAPEEEGTGKGSPGMGSGVKSCSFSKLHDFTPDPQPRGPQPRGPVPVERLGELLTEVFGHASFRPYQEAVCRAVVEGRDALLVMPTGAGKSLCYQL
ncbi:MAG TPA: DNA topoisomerase 3, partial [Thermoanaerobaculia bacterium]|nr:DNA topoisomerase 3 [Thermoanaerobaculia bacterium]